MGARILVVDDSATIQKVVELTFSKEDFVLVQARSGDEGIRKAMETRPDLILLDILMPDKDGYAVCAALRAQPVLRNVPVILLTGTFEVYDKEKAAKVGADDFVTKPFESQLLIGKVKKLLFTKSLAVTPPPARPATAPPPAKPVTPTGLPRALSLSSTIEPPKPAPAAPPPSELSAPSLEISQDQLWQMLEAPVTPPPPARSFDLNLDVLEPAATAAPPEVTLSDVSALDFEAVEAAPAAPEALDRETPPAAAPSFDLSLDVLEPAATAAPPEVTLSDVSALDFEAVEAAPVAPEALDRETPPAAAPSFDLSLDVLEPASTADVLEMAESDAAGLEQTVDRDAPVVPGVLESDMSLAPEAESEEPTHLGDLSLDDLLAGVAGVSLEDQATPQVADDVPSMENVFDLSQSLEAPPLPMVEAGKGEPPSLSIEELLSSIESGSAESGEAPVEAAEVDLLSAAFPPEEVTPSAAEAPGGPSLDFDLGMELHAVEALAAAEAPPIEEASVPAEPGVAELDLGLTAFVPSTAIPVAATPILEEVAAVPTAEAPGLDLESVAAEAAAAAAASAMPDLEAVAADLLPPAPPAVPSHPGTSLAEARDVVTEQVARDLARELSEKLMERIEKVIWEVVPDLAEVLIAREIERIRRMAEEQKSA
jgi:CheY-like chemotaxis protein